MIIASRASYPRQVQTLLDGLKEHVEENSREFKAIVEIDGKFYSVMSIEIPKDHVQSMIDNGEMEQYVEDF